MKKAKWTLQHCLTSIIFNSKAVLKKKSTIFPAFKHFSFHYFNTTEQSYTCS